MVIDGSTQTGFNGTPLIETRRHDRRGFTYALTISAGGSTVRSLAINRFGGGGIQLHTAGGNTIAGNFIGTNPAGTAALANATGVLVWAGSAGNTIGGLSPSDRNLISGNSNGVTLSTTGNNVLGNYIGTDLSGLVSVGNGTGVLDGTGGNAVGGGAGTTPPGPSQCTEPATDFRQHGIRSPLSAAIPSTVEGNFIGTDVTGLAALGNGSYGIPIFNGTGHSIRNNVVSANFVGIGMNAAPGVVIQGNYVGTDAAGTAALPNTFAGIGAFNGSDGTQIGGVAGAPGTPCVYPCNLISGNTGYGISIGTGGSSTGDEDDIIRGNCIGTQVDCLTRLPNGTQGIEIGFQASNVTVGGTGVGEGNVVAFNGRTGSNRRAWKTHFGATPSLQQRARNRSGGGGVTPNDRGTRTRSQSPAELSDHHLGSKPPSHPGRRRRDAHPGIPPHHGRDELRPRLLLQRACADRPQEFLEGRTYLGSTTVTTDGAGLAVFDVTFPSTSRQPTPSRPRPPILWETRPSSRSGCPCSFFPRPDRPPEARTCRSRAPTFRRARR